MKRRSFDISLEFVFISRTIKGMQGNIGKKFFKKKLSQNYQLLHLVYKWLPNFLNGKILSDKKVDIYKRDVNITKLPDNKIQTDTEYQHLVI